MYCTLAHCGQPCYIVTDSIDIYRLLGNIPMVNWGIHTVYRSAFDIYIGECNAGTKYTSGVDHVTSDGLFSQEIAM